MFCYRTTKVIMSKITDFVTNALTMETVNIVLNIILACIFSLVISYLFITFGKSASNKRRLSRTFVLLTITMVLIIALIRTSIALSLGLVGALSIVRFRTAIKDPEDLAYLFLSIGVGLGFGSGERKITVVASAVIIVLIIILGLLDKRKKLETFNLSIVSSILTLDQVVELTKTYSDEVMLKRTDITENYNSYYFLLNLKNYNELNQVIDSVKEIDDKANVSYLSIENY